MKFKTLLLSVILAITTLSLANCTNYSDSGCTTCGCKKNVSKQDG